MDVDLIKAVVLKDDEDLSIADVVAVNTESPFSEGFSSNINRAKLKVKLRNGKLTLKSCVIKKSPTGGYIRKLLEKYQLAERETEVYEEIIPGLEEVIKEHGDVNEKIWCRYMGSKENMIFLEDLKNYGYRTVDVMECLDYEHMILSLSTLGKFHAISKVFFKNVGQETITKYRKYPMFGDHIMLDMFNTGGLIMLARVMRESWGPEWSDIADKLDKAASQNEAYFQDLFQNTKEEMDVFNHGDLWCCNIMFQYHEFKNLPIRAKFVDFQLSHYNSMAWDLTFFIYSSVRASLRRRSLPDFLDAYFKAFTDTLDSYGYNGPRPTRQSFDEEMNRFKYMGLTQLCSCYTITTTRDNTFTMKPLLQPTGPRLCYLPHIYKIPRYKSDVEEDLINFASEGII